YHRWQSGAPAQPPAPVQTEAPSPAETQAPPVAAAPLSSDLIDDFEAGPPANTDGWTAYWDEATQTTIGCAPAPGTAHTGNAALHIDYALPPETWATCVLGYWEIRDWSSMQGLSFYLHADQPGLIFEVYAYGGTVQDWQGYYTTLQTTQEMVDGWAYVEIPWSELLRAEWEDPNRPPYDPAVVTGVGFGFGTYNQEPGNGKLWVDEFRLLGAPTLAAETPASPPPAEATVPAMQATEAIAAPTAAPGDEQVGRRIKLCPGSFAVGMLVAAGAVWSSWRKRLAHTP
ncbi:MAG: hypothetical protein JXA78_08850, partial [Anaerolineales bacterium]|nr:hypothetical protein [Anaerolineales bacterium]